MTAKKSPRFGNLVVGFVAKESIQHDNEHCIYSFAPCVCVCVCSQFSASNKAKPTNTFIATTLHYTTRTTTHTHKQIMKINNSTVTPIETTSNCFVNENKYVDRKKLETDQTKESPSKSTESTFNYLGRQLFYIPTLFLTPVLSSVRTKTNGGATTDTAKTMTGCTDKSVNQKDADDRTRLNKQEMDDLCVRLSDVLTVKDNAPAHDEEQDDHDESEPDDSSESNVLGRVEFSEFNYKTNQVRKVVRSSRLQPREITAH